MMNLKFPKNYSIAVDDNVGIAFEAVATSEGLKLPAFLAKNVRATVEGVVVKYRLNLGDYSLQLAKSDYLRLEEMVLRDHGQGLEAYLASKVL